MAKVKREDKKRGGWADYIGDLTLRGLIWSLNRLPLRARLRFSSWMMRKGFAGRAGYRARAMANLAYVWPEQSIETHESITEGALDNAARTLIENYDVQGLLKRMAKVDPEGPGVPILEKARKEGTPVLLVTGHYGNFEAARASLVARGYQIGGLYRPMANPYVNAHYAQNMHALSGPVFEQGTRGTIGLMRHVKQGGMAVLLFDLFDSAGLPIPFLGKPAPTLSSAAEIALKTGALVVPFFGIREADGVGFRAVFETPIAHSDPETMTREISARLEARIHADPAQWFWIHRRWKPKRQAKHEAKRQRATAAPKIGP